MNIYIVSLSSRTSPNQWYRGTKQGILRTKFEIRRDIPHTL